MPNKPSDTASACNIVVVGPPGSGKAAFVKAVAARHGGAPTREFRLAECTVIRAEFLSVGPDGGQLRVNLQTLTGPHDYQASEELLLRDADGFLFLCEPGREAIGKIRENLLQFTSLALRCGIDFGSVPVAFQYQRAERHPGWDADLIDQRLGVPTDSVPRYCATSTQPDAPGQTFDAIIERVRLVSAAGPQDP